MHTPVSVEIRREDYHSLTDYAVVSIAYEVREAVNALTTGAAPLPLPRRVVTPAFRKDYDAIPGNHPDEWSTRFAVDRAHFISAYSMGGRVGGAVVIVDPSDVAQLGGDPGYALVWDLRVAPEARGHGIGRALLMAAEASVQEIGGAGIVAETQDVNVAACQLYARAGYVITSIDSKAYPELSGELQIMWSKIFEFPLPSG